MYTIPETYFLDKEMSSNDKIILMFIYSFSKTELLSPTFIAEELWLTPPTVRKSLKELSSSKKRLIIYNKNCIDKIDYINDEFYK